MAGTVKLVRSLTKMQALVKRAKRRGQSIAFVPTMGALHAGHLKLVEQARRAADLVVVSIFINPTQFEPQEDLKKYPRNLVRDLARLRKARADIVFCPTAKAMYPAGAKTWVEVGQLSEILCGRVRPGHFRGVITVVVKLFNIVRPDMAFFGEKDFQQQFIICQMVSDLNFPVKIVIVPTVREADGLALSSRNAYLSKQERRTASSLYRALRLARQLVKSGERSPSVITSRMRQLLRRYGITRIDYIALVDPLTLAEVKQIRGRVRALAAVWVGRTRLTDNLAL